MKAIKSKLPSCSGTLQVELKVQKRPRRGKEEEGGCALHLLTVVGENISPLFGVFGAAKYAMLLSPRSAVQINCRVCGYAMQCGRRQRRRGSVIRLQNAMRGICRLASAHSLLLSLSASFFLLHIV